MLAGCGACHGPTSVGPCTHRSSSLSWVRLQGMFNDDAFGKMKKGARIVNVARGGVIDEAALARALDNGQVAQVMLTRMPWVYQNIIMGKLPVGITCPAPYCGSGTRGCLHGIWFAAQIDSDLPGHWSSAAPKNALSVKASKQIPCDHM